MEHTMKYLLGPINKVLQARPLANKHGKRLAVLPLKEERCVLNVCPTKESPQSTVKEPRQRILNPSQPPSHSPHLAKH